MKYEITYRVYDNQGKPYEYTLPTDDLKELAKMIDYIAANEAHMELVKVEAI